MDLVELKAASDNHNVHPWEQARLRYVTKQISRLKPNTTNLRVLDAGCGDAFVVSELAREFPEHTFFGYDPFFEEDVLGFIRKKHDKIENLKLSNSLDALSPGKNRIDLVTLLDVIEHVEDEVSMLKELRAHSSISADTVFMITVPAYQHLFSNHDVFMLHYRRYNKALLKSRLQKAGFEVQEMRYFFFSLMLPRWIQVKLEKRISSPDDAEHQGVSSWKGGSIATALFRGILVLDWRITEMLNRWGISLPGLSLYCICRPAAS